jgi:PAS domain S-box-containing protein
VIVTDLDGTVRSVNRAACEATGYTPEEVQGKAASLLFKSGEAWPNFWTEPLRAQFLESGAARDLETGLQTKDGRTLLVQAHGSVLHGIDAAPQGIVVVLTDISKSRRLEARLLQSKRMSALGRMAAGLAHELKNPLSGVIANAQFLQEDLENDDMKVLARDIIAAGRRCSEVIDNLLVFARDNPNETATCDLTSIIEKALSMAKNRSSAANIVVRTDLESAPVRCNRIQVEQVFYNLITNAFDAMPDGGTVTIRSRIASEGAPANSWITVDVADTGIGISKEDQEKIFDVFFTTKPPGRGTGIGLSLCYELIQRHGGRISLQSEPGKGARFTVAMPLDA